MGQAKRRGTFEERKAQSIAEQEKTLDLLRKQEAEWFESLTEEERERVIANRKKGQNAVRTMMTFSSLV